MDTLSLSGAQAAARSIAIDRLRAVAQDMGNLVERLGLQPETLAIAQCPLALATRSSWLYAQVALIQADAGMASPRLIAAIAERDPRLATPQLRRLAESTLIAAERRLHGRTPEPLLQEASR
jgi:hypothetical protein